LLVQFLVLCVRALVQPAHRRHSLRYRLYLRSPPWSGADTGRRLICISSTRAALNAPSRSDAFRVVCALVREKCQRDRAALAQ
jgi:hypothetical protein